MGRLSKIKWCLLGCLIIILISVAASVFMPDRLTGAVRWVAQKGLAGELRGLVSEGETGPDDLVEMIVERVVVSQIDYKPVVVLKQKDEELYLPIWIGLAEANAIVVILEEVRVPRPLTPDLLCYMVDKMGASIDYVVIKDIKDKTFYASIILQADWRCQKIDARPSDAIAIALRVQSPIYVTRDVLGKAGVPLYDEAEKYTARRLEQPKPIS
jgi:bifunctional DNase/RNase